MDPSGNPNQKPELRAPHTSQAAKRKPKASASKPKEPKRSRGDRSRSSSPDMSHPQKKKSKKSIKRHSCFSDSSSSSDGSRCGQKVWP